MYEICGTAIGIYIYCILQSLMILRFLIDYERTLLIKRGYQNSIHINRSLARDAIYIAFIPVVNIIVAFFNTARLADMMTRTLAGNTDIHTAFLSGINNPDDFKV